MLHAVARDPAMIVYLDSAQNRKGAPNENFARELMELFTLGEGNYGERDVKEAARAFTGWSLDRDSGQFDFRRVLHDYGEQDRPGRHRQLRRRRRRSTSCSRNRPPPTSSPASCGASSSRPTPT